MVAERRWATPRVETLESLRAQAWDSGSRSSSRPSRPANRHGHHSRLRSISATDETRSCGCDAAKESCNVRDWTASTQHFRMSQRSQCQREGRKFWSFMSDLHLWMQAWSNQGEMILTSAERVDKFNSSATAIDCPEAEFRLTEASLCQVLHRTMANEPLKKVQNTGDREEVRSEEHVRQKFSVRSTHQQLIRKIQSEGRGAFRRHREERSSKNTNKF